MKKLSLFISGVLLLSQSIIAQNSGIKLPSFDEEGLIQFITSDILQAVIFVVAGVAIAMALFFLLGNIRMAYDTDVISDNSVSPRFPTPTNVRINVGFPGSTLNKYASPFIPIDNELEEQQQDLRGEATPQRGD